VETRKAEGQSGERQIEGRVKSERKKERKHSEGTEGMKAKRQSLRIEDKGERFKQNRQSRIGHCKTAGTKNSLYSNAVMKAVADWLQPDLSVCGAKISIPKSCEHCIYCYQQYDQVVVSYWLQLNPNLSRQLNPRKLEK